MKVLMSEASADCIIVPRVLLVAPRHLVESGICLSASMSFAVCSLVQAPGEVPVTMLTAGIEATDVVDVMSAGKPAMLSQRVPALQWVSRSSSGCG
jgi:hypothetical protein